MSLQLHYLCSYYSQWAHNKLAPRTPALWDAYKFARAVKTRQINGTCQVPTTMPKTINSENVGLARELFGKYIRQTLPTELYDEATFVPVPSKDSWSIDEFRSLTMLREALPFKTAQVSALVKFGVERPRATEGGERGYGAIRPYLARTVNAIPNTPIVLVDDILTTGGSMLAVRDFLKDFGGIVTCAVVCAKTTYAAETAFLMREVKLDDWIGQIDI